MKSLSAVFLLFYFQLTFAQDPRVEFTNITAYSFFLTIVDSNPQNGYLIVRSTEPIVFAPSNNINYQKGLGLGNNAKVLANSTSKTHIVNDVQENTTYYISVFKYSAASTFISYFSPLEYTVTSAKADVGNYYNGLSSNTPSFVSDLTQRINNHNLVAYSQFDNLIVPVIFERDTINSQKAVTCEYSGEIKTYTPPFSFTDIGYSREHLMPRSWMPTGGDVATAEGADYHNLALTNLNNVNNLRSNYAFGNVITPSTTFLDCRLGKNADNVTVFEPTDSKKGDIARAIFYQILCYNGKGGSNWGFFNLTNTRALEQDVNTLIQWHFNDLPDGFEKAKHEYIYTLQNNRNPFIDYPELVDCIDFNQVLKNATCNSTVSIDEIIYNNSKANIFPNPVENLLNIQHDNTFSNIKSVIIFDLSGKKIKSLQPKAYFSVYSENISDLFTGSYLINIEFDNGDSVTKRLIKQ